VHASLSALKNRPERVEKWAPDLVESIDLALAAGEPKFETRLTAAGFLFKVLLASHVYGGELKEQQRKW